MSYNFVTVPKSISTGIDSNTVIDWINGDTKLNNQNCRLYVNKDEKTGKVFAQLFTSDGKGNGWLVAQWIVK